LIGPVLGSTLFLLLEEYLPELMESVLSGAGDHWMFLFGPILILIVLFARGGVYALISKVAGRGE
jgi:branched-chain amino acid transport system permease protein